MIATMNTQFLLLIVSLPPNPSSLRVRVWRRLRALGAVALKRTVYLLPDTPDNYEQFQWLGQEIQRERGETILLRVDQIENMSRTDIIRLFHEARDPDYRQIATRYRKVIQALERKSAAVSARVDRDLTQLTKDFEKLRELDFFDAPGRAEVERLREAIDMRKRPPEKPTRPDRPTLDLRALRGQRWVTRPRPHVDRIASAWLIKRFIDPEATFLFACPQRVPLGRDPLRHPEGGAQPRRGRLHVRDTHQAGRPSGPPAHAPRRDRSRGGPARREVSAGRGARDRPGSPRVSRGVSR